MFKLEPVFKDYIWGGNRLKNDFNKETDLDIVAESWELCCHKNGTNKICGKSEKLDDLIKNNKEILGSNCDKFEDFPVLIKLIDAKDNLSIQVHPDNDFAMKYENSVGKTEMWYVVDCEEGAYLYYGFNKEISKEEFENRIKENTLLEVLNKVPIKKGNVFFITAGTVHAICKGTLIAEIQQNSDITYRVYDYGRVGKDGRPRELHIDKAISVAKLKMPDTYSVKVISEDDGAKNTLLCKCDFFETHKIDVFSEFKVNVDEMSFYSVLCLEGSANITSDISNLDIHKGDSVFIPAGEGECVIRGNCEVVLTFVP